jgi:cell cycle sensor histidine kinase DivJ
VLRVLRTIAGKAFPMTGNSASATHRGNRGLAPKHAVIAGLVAVSAASLVALAGWSWSSILPSGFAAFAASWLACLAHEELRPRATVVPARAQADPADPLDGLPGLITRHDAGGQLLSVNGADRATFGFSGRIAPQAYFDAIHVSGRLHYLHAIDALRQGSSAASAEFMLAVGADLRPVRAHFRGAFKRDGSLEAFTIQTVDIAGEVALREDVSAWKIEARSANDAKTRFLAAVSHELRTPLNAVLGFSDILIGEYFGKFENERQREYVELINQSGHHLLAVVNTMLDMSKIEAGRYELIKEPFAIGAVMRSVDEMLGLEARRKGVVLTTRVARGLDEVVADRRAVKQVLINLANNAIKFTETGGVVTIDAVAERGNLVISVSDTGIGIPAEKLALIGKPFMQVQNDYTRQYEGTGLGLALVKGLVGLHGGELRIESEEHKGTVMTVTLPLDGEADAGCETFEFPPRLNETYSGENRDGATAQAKIA